VETNPAQFRVIRVVYLHGIIFVDGSKKVASINFVLSVQFEGMEATPVYQLKSTELHLSLSFQQSKFDQALFTT
jgi:hypothetical protein